MRFSALTSVGALFICAQNLPAEVKRERERFMNKLPKSDYQKIMTIVECEILNHSGSGFKVELAPVITKQVKYMSIIPVFSFQNKIVWKECEKIKTPSYSRDMASMTCDYPHYSVGLYTEYNLPNGIKIERTPVHVLKDERLEHEPLIRQFQDAVYTEGIGTSICVSDEYAARYFRDKYTETGFPFRDRLLENHKEVLKDILEGIRNSGSLFSCSLLKENKLSITSKYVGNGVRKITFQELNMMPLDSMGQVYGMALT